MSQLTHDEICQLTPHAGNMCMLDDVLSWDKKSIHCTTSAHMQSDNPLFSNGRIHSINCIELAGQATIVHGTLCWEEGEKVPDLALLVSIRDVQIHKSRLDDINQPLDVHADVMDILEFASNYEFYVKAGDEVIVSGRLTSKLIFENEE